MEGFAPGTEISGKYRLESKLGEGGMGEVWAASHLVTRKRVALKLLKPTASGHQAEHVKRFFREARAASAVRHPNVVQIHDVFEHEGAPIMVMDLLDGESLSDKLDREAIIRLPELARILAPIMSAVGTAHARGIVHRDLKPENIFLARTATSAIEPKVLDFGIAKLSATDGDAAQTAALTRTGSMMGTPYYMSPEQASGERGVDHRTDVWAMGVILYECLSSQRPFDGDNFGQVFKAILTQTPTSLGELRPELPPDVVALVVRMLQKDAAARLPDLREALDILLMHTDVDVPAVSAPGAAPFPPASSPFSAGPLSSRDVVAPTVAEPAYETGVVPAQSLRASNVQAATLDASSIDQIRGATPAPKKRRLPVPVVGGLGIVGAGVAVWVVATLLRPGIAAKDDVALEHARAAAVTPGPDTAVAARAPEIVPVVSAPAAPAPSEVASAESLPTTKASAAVAPVRARPSAKEHPAPSATPPSPHGAPTRLPGGILDQEKAPF